MSLAVLSILTSIHFISSLVDCISLTAMRYSEADLIRQDENDEEVNITDERNTVHTSTTTTSMTTSTTSTTSSSSLDAKGKMSEWNV
jgi:hypothetical protein